MDTERLKEALIAADAAGDTEAAMALAARLRKTPVATLKESFRERLMRTDPGQYDPQSSEFQARFGPLSKTDQERALEAIPGPFGLPGIFKVASSEVRAGAGKAFVDLARGAGQLIRPPGSRGTLVSREDVQRSRELDAPLMATTGGKAGNIAAGTALMAPALAIPGVNTVAGAGVLGGAYGALQPSVSTKETLLNTGLGAVTGAGVQYALPKIGGAIASRLAKRSATAQSQRATNAVRDATLAEGRAAGYVVPPSTTNPTFTNQALESIAGKAATQQAASLKNQHVTDSLIRQELGMAKDAAITRESLKGIRQEAGKIYEQVASAGDIIPDSQYAQELANLARTSNEIAASFPKANVAGRKEIGELVESLWEPRFNARAAMEYLKDLRKQASSNLSFLNSADPAKRTIGMAQRDAAETLEDMVMRHLYAQGRGDLSVKFNAARTRIAQAHSIENAINESTGHVVASRLASQFKRGKPLSGGLGTAAKFSQAFPKATEEIRHSGPVSLLDAVAATAGGAAINPAFFALPLARIGARSSLLSRVGQGLATPTYSPSALGTGALTAAQLAARVPAPLLFPLVQPSQQ